MCHQKNNGNKGCTDMREKHGCSQKRGAAAMAAEKQFFQIPKQDTDQSVLGTLAHRRRFRFQLQGCEDRFVRSDHRAFLEPQPLSSSSGHTPTQPTCIAGSRPCQATPGHPAPGLQNNTEATQTQISPGLLGGTFLVKVRLQDTKQIAQRPGLVTQDFHRGVEPNIHIECLEFILQSFYSR